MSIFSQIFESITQHVDYLLNGRDLPNRHWSACRLIHHSQQLTMAIQDYANCIGFQINEAPTTMDSASPKKVRETYDLIQSDLMLIQDESSTDEERQEAARQMFKNAILLEAYSSCIENMMDQVLTELNYNTIPGVPPPLCTLVH